MNKCTCYCAKCGRTFEIPWLAHEWDTDKYHDCKPRTVDEIGFVNQEFKLPNE